MARSKKSAPPVSPQAKLAAVIKSARDAMRKDAGLNGDLDRIPQLAWLLFLKAFDGLEQNREITDDNFRPAIEPPYRWRDWAADPNGRTGEAHLDFINGELLPYLRGLTGTGSHDPRDVLAAVFKETNNRMLSGYLLRDVVNKVNEINFASSDDIHTMAHVYESMLREMRDAAGDSGEFYTPRPIIRFIVQQIDPKLGEIVLDPACGTGGFLVEALEHLAPKVRTTQQRRALHTNLRGIEKKPLPYLLGMMNLVLHGVGQPNIIRGNALAEPIMQISKARRVDVVITNPPFGGEEEKSIQANFPADSQTAETAWLFLQLVIRQLKDGGRCGIVVPHSVLFGSGVGARIKKHLLTDCDLHTVVRLPDGAFAPYTDIPSNLLFFDKTGRTKEVWFYEIPSPAGRKKYSKTKPLRFEEFADCQAWWTDRVENERAWRVPIADIEANDYNLDLRNPNRPDDLAHRPPAELLAELVHTEQEILGLLNELQAEIARSMTVERVRVGDLLRLERVSVDPNPAIEYVSIGIRSFGKGMFHYEPKLGDQLGSLRFFEVQPNRLVVSNIKGWEGAIAVSSDADAGCIASNRFLLYLPIDDRIDVRWARWYFLSDPGIQMIQRTSPGSADRNRTLAIDRFEALEIPLPAIVDQRRVADRLDRLEAAASELRERSGRASALIGALAVSATARPDLNDDAKYRAGWRRVALGEVVEPSTAQVQVEPSQAYPIAGIYSFGRGLIDRGVIAGAETSYTTLTTLHEGDIVVSKLNGWEGAVTVVGPRFAEYCVSSEYPTFKPDREELLPAFFTGIARSPSFWEDLNSNARGSMVRRRRINATEFLATQIWLPPMETQRHVAGSLQLVDRAAQVREVSSARVAAMVPAALNQAFAPVS